MLGGFHARLTSATARTAAGAKAASTGAEPENSLVSKGCTKTLLLSISRSSWCPCSSRKRHSIRYCASSRERLVISNLQPKRQNGLPCLSNLHVKFVTDVRSGCSTSTLVGNQTPTVGTFAGAGTATDGLVPLTAEEKFPADNQSEPVSSGSHPASLSRLTKSFLDTGLSLSRTTWRPALSLKALTGPTSTKIV